MHFLHRADSLAHSLAGGLLEQALALGTLEVEALLAYHIRRRAPGVARALHCAQRLVPQQKWTEPLLLLVPPHAVVVWEAAAALPGEEWVAAAEVRVAAGAVGHTPVVTHQKRYA
jgi:hypothetical protein